MAKEAIPDSGCLIPDADKRGIYTCSIRHFGPEGNKMNDDSFRIVSINQKQAQVKTKNPPFVRVF